MGKWAIRTPRHPPGSELPAPPSTALAPISRERSARHSSPQSPTSQATSTRLPSPPRKKYKVEVLIPRLVDEPPELQTPALLPPHDTTAYIKEKMHIQSAGAAADGNPLPMNLGYLVGWTDLRGASMIVPAADILDYVSPYALEQFEYEDWKQRKQKEKEAHEALRREMEAKKAALESGKATRVKKKPGKKPKGRPRKKIEVPVDEGVIQEEVRKRTGSRVREGEPTLSTPKKGVLAGVVREGDAPERDYEQSYGDTEMETETSHPATSREGSRGYDSEPPRKKLRSSASPTKEAGFGGGFVSGMSPMQRARIPVQDSLRSLLQPQEAYPSLTGFTPVVPPRQARQTPITTTSSESKDASVSSRRSPKPKKTKTTSKTSTPRSGTPKRQNGADIKSYPVEEPEAEDLEAIQYEVKRLESMDEMVIDGKRERFFLVRWEGDWTPEENPTWEPEENIPRKLVRKYLAKNPPGTGKKKKKKKKKKKPGAWSGRYSSVTDAFEDLGPEEGDAKNGVVEDSQDENDGEETFQVTEGPSSEKMGLRGAGAHIWNKALGFALGRGLGVGRAS
ncbi:hypothetical protein VUR80DRAFT_5416 [Thermomyces stellatus]